MICFPAWIRYIVTDSYYSKYKWVTGVVQLGFHAIGKLRCKDLLCLDFNPKFGQLDLAAKGGNVNIRFDGDLIAKVCDASVKELSSDDFTKVL